MRALEQSMGAADAADLQAALADPLITTSVIGRTLRSLGHRVGDDSLRRHRRKVCQCESR